MERYDSALGVRKAFLIKSINQAYKRRKKIPHFEERKAPDGSIGGIVSSGILLSYKKIP